MKSIAFSLAVLAGVILAAGDASAARGKNGNGKYKASSSRSGFTQVYGYTKRASYAETFYRHVGLSSQ